MDVEVSVNGNTPEKVTLPKDSNEKMTCLELLKGMNTVTVTLLDDPETAIESLVINTIHKNVRGATYGYTEYEAEKGNTNALILTDDRSYRISQQSEASGRSAVKLEDSGDYVEFIITEPTNSLVVRYCIPDSSDGFGIQATLGVYINEERVENLNLTSKYSWVYGNYPFTNNPSDGLPHRFYDEASLLFNTEYPAGTVIRLQKDDKDTADYYVIDFIDTEFVEKEHTQPDNSLSVADYGAVANDGKDDTQALSDCMAAASEVGKEVWIPAGTFSLTKDASIVVNYEGLTIRGAGMWRTVLEGDGAGFMVKANNVSFYDFKLDGTEYYRDDALGRTAFEATSSKAYVKNLSIQNIWIEHEKVGVWTTYMDYMHIIGCRIRNTFADGINLCGGTSHSLVEQNSIRNTGDDAIAMWSSSSYSDAAYGGYDTENVIRHNSAGLQCLANNIAVYGGSNNKISNNYLYDTVVAGGGINISTEFEPVGFNGFVIIENNILVRCGSHDVSGNKDYGAIWLYITSTDMDAKLIIKNNRIIDSSYQGISVLGYDNAISQEIELSDNFINNSGTWGIDISERAVGSLLMNNNVIVSSGVGEISNRAKEKFELKIICVHKNTEIQNIKDATCIVEGYTGDTVCQDCGIIIEMGKVISKKEHEFTNGTCIVCGAHDPAYEGKVKGNTGNAGGTVGKGGNTGNVDGAGNYGANTGDGSKIGDGSTGTDIGNTGGNLNDSIVKIPQTGDEMNIRIWVYLAALALVGFGVTLAGIYHNSIVIKRRPEVP